MHHFPSSRKNIPFRGADDDGIVGIPAQEGLAAQTQLDPLKPSAQYLVEVDVCNWDTSAPVPIPALGRFPSFSLAPNHPYEMLQSPTDAPRSRTLQSTGMGMNERAQELAAPAVRLK